MRIWVLLLALLLPVPTLAQSVRINGIPSRAQMGVDNVDNTSDVNKPVSTAQAIAINAKLDKTRFSTYSGNRQGEIADLQSGKLAVSAAASTYKTQSAFNSYSTAQSVKLAALTPSSIGAVATVGGEMTGLLKTSGGGSYTYSPWGGLLGDSLAPLSLQSYVGSTSSAYTGDAPLLRLQEILANTTTPAKRGTTAEVETILRPSHMQKWSTVVGHLTDNAVGQGDHSVFSAYVHQNTNRNTAGSVVSTGGDDWGVHVFMANQGHHANSIAAELNNVNTDTVDYLDDTPDGSGPNTSGYMQTALQITPDGGTKHSTRAISIVPSSGTGYDTGITLRGHRSTGIYINSPITATRTDIKWGSGTSTVGVDLSAHTFTGSAIVLGASQTITDGTNTKTLAQLVAGGSLPSIPQFTLLGNNTGSTATATSLTTSQAKTMLGYYVSGDSPTFSGATVDTNTIAVDSTYHRLGIGGGGPQRKLDVIDASGNPQLRVSYDSTHYGELQADSSGNLVLSTSPASLVKLTGGMQLNLPASKYLYATIGGGATPTEVARFETTGNAGATRGPRINLYGQNAGASQQVAAIDGLSPSAGNGSVVISTVDSSTLTEHLRVSSTGVAATGPLTSTSSITGTSLSAGSGHLTAESVTSTGATGSGKLVFDTSPTLVTPILGVATATSVTASGQFTSAVATGTAPLVVTSTTKVANLNVEQVDGHDVGTAANNIPALDGSQNLNLPANVLATGIMDGTTPITITTSTTATIGGTYKTGYTLNNYATAGTAVAYTLPTAAAGLQYCVRNYTGKTGALTVNSSASGQFIDYLGANTASGGYVVSSGALGDAACFIGVDATHWLMYNNSGTWTVH